MLRRLLAAAAFFLAAVSPAQAQDAPFKPVQFELANGMQVVVIPDRRAPVVTHMVWYRVGSADEPRGKTGIAHFLEHLMFRGTPKFADGEFSRTIAKNGGQDNAFTFYDYTAYHQRVASDRLRLVMEMEADRMVNLGLTEEVVTPERKVILEERDSRTDTNPQALFFEQLYASLYVAHPYRNPVIGWESDMQGLGLEDAIDLYGKKYAPNNAILVVAGDVTAEGVRTLADEIYGAIPRRETYPRRRTPEPPPIAARRVTMTDARAGNPVFARLYLAPSYSTAEGREAYALELFAAILGGGETSRLNQALVKDRQIASSASAWYDGDGLEDRMVGLFGVPMPGTSLADLEAAMTAELEKLAKDGPAPDELERAKTVLRANAIYAQDSQEGLANYYGAGVTLGRPLDELVAWPDRIADVTAEDIKAAAAKYLTMERSVSGTLEPEAASDGAPQPAPAGPPSGGVQ